MTTKQIQIRGNCQCCGKLQAVVGPFMSKHGYIVDHGWLNGVCSGDRQQPLQVSRSHTDLMVADVLAQCAALRIKADETYAGKHDPVEYKGYQSKFVNGKRVPVMELFADATEYKKQEIREQMQWALKSRAKAGEDFAQMMTQLADKVHGTALIEVEKKEVTPIQYGEKKVGTSGMILTCLRTDKARVYYSFTRDGSDKKGQSWMGSTAWRKLEVSQ